MDKEGRAVMCFSRELAGCFETYKQYTRFNLSGGVGYCAGDKVKAATPAIWRRPGRAYQNNKQDRRKTMGKPALCHGLPSYALLFTERECNRLHFGAFRFTANTGRNRYQNELCTGVTRLFDNKLDRRD